MDIPSLSNEQRCGELGQEVPLLEAAKRHACVLERPRHLLDRHAGRAARPLVDLGRERHTPARRGWMRGMLFGARIDLGRVPQALVHVYSRF